MNKIPVVVIYAPTACGKTALTEKLFGKSSLSVLKEKAQIISADSQSAYKYLNIGTAKPGKEEQNEVTHHLVDILMPDSQYDVSDFVLRADSICKELWSKKLFPVVCGGSAFYIKCFLQGLPKAPESSPEIRELICKRMETEGKEKLYEELKQVDLQTADKININDEYRIRRALEVYYSCHKPLSSFEKPSSLRGQYDFCTIILERDREDLYNRINLRVEKMFEQGLAGEVEELKKMGYNETTPALKAIGYSEFFKKELTTVNQIKSQIKLDSRHYAKKQYTFMKGIPDAVYVDSENFSEIEKIISDFFNKYL